MQKYSDYRPTEFDHPGSFLHDQQDWLVVPVGQNRNSEALDRSNFRMAEQMLSVSQDPSDNDCYENHRFGHWACGWFEILIVKPGSDCERIAKEIEDSIESYPILDGSDFSTLENEEWDEQEDNAIKHLASIFDLKFDDYYDESEGRSWYVTKINMEDSGNIVDSAKCEGLEVECDDENNLYVRLKRGD